MNVYVRAGIVAIFVGLVFAGLFYLWRSNSLPTQSIQQIAKIDHMETDGIPNFTGVDLSGAPYGLTSVKDQVVIVNFWATWCGPCVEEIPSLIGLVQAMKGKLRLIAVSGDDSADEVQAFLRSFPALKDPNITILLDSDRHIADQYGVDRYPESFIADKKMKLAKKIVGSISWHTKDSEEYMTQLFAKP